MNLKRLLVMVLILAIIVPTVSCGKKDSPLAPVYAIVAAIILLLQSEGPEEYAKNQSVPRGEAIKAYIFNKCVLAGGGEAAIDRCITSETQKYRAKYPPSKLDVTVDGSEATIANPGNSSTDSYQPFADPMDTRRHTASFAVGPDIDREVYLVSFEPEGVKPFVGIQGNYLFISALTTASTDSD